MKRLRLDDGKIHWEVTGLKLRKLLKVYMQQRLRD